MATFSIKSDSDYYIDIGSGGKHVMTSWVVALDRNFLKTIDESLEDPDNVLEWKTPLPKRPEDKINQNAEEFYSDLAQFYVRVMIHVGEVKRDPSGKVIDKVITASSPWLEIGPLSQLEQDIIVTQNYEVIRNTTTAELGWV